MKNEINPEKYYAQILQILNEFVGLQNTATNNLNSISFYISSCVHNYKSIY